MTGSDNTLMAMRDIELDINLNWKLTAMPMDRSTFHKDLIDKHAHLDQKRQEARALAIKREQWMSNTDFINPLASDYDNHFDKQRF